MQCFDIFGDGKIPQMPPPGCAPSKAVVLNLFDVEAHFSPRLWFWAHFTKNLFQNSWLGIPITSFKNIQVISEHFSAYLKELRGPPEGRGPPVEKRISKGYRAWTAMWNKHYQYHKQIRYGKI